MKILILGGYGNAGRLISKLLLLHTDEEIIIAGRNIAKAALVVKELGREFNNQRVSALKVDASDEKMLETVFKEVKIVIVSSSTLQFARKVIDAAIRSRIDYFDLQLSAPDKIEYLKEREDEIKSKQLCFITDGGFHPGLPAAMVRYSSKYFQNLELANVYSYLNLDWGQYHFSPSTGREMIEEFNNYMPEVYSDGRWKKLKWSNYKKIDFGNGIGERYIAPMMLEEMKYLPNKYSSLKEMGFYVCGFNWFVNYISIPFSIVCMKISKSLCYYPAVKLFELGLKKFSRPPYICILKLIAAGIKDKNICEYRMEISHRDGYLLTAAPVVACLLQYLDGSISKPGLHFQANVVEPERFFRDLRVMGIDMKINHSL